MIQITLLILSPSYMTKSIPNYVQWDYLLVNQFYLQVFENAVSLFSSTKSKNLTGLPGSCTVYKLVGLKRHCQQGHILPDHQVHFPRS